MEQRKKIVSLKRSSTNTFYYHKLYSILSPASSKNCIKIHFTQLRIFLLKSLRYTLLQCQDCHNRALKSYTRLCIHIENRRQRNHKEILLQNQGFSLFFRTILCTECCCCKIREREREKIKEDWEDMCIGIWHICNFH